MKKLVTLPIALTAICALFTLAACGGTETPSENGSGNNNETTCTHTYGDWVVTTEATCTAAGVETRTCSKCGATETQDIAALGHTEVTDEGYAATCTKKGLTDGSHCSVCNTELLAQEEIPALGHNYVDGVCTRCGESNPNDKDDPENYTEGMEYREVYDNGTLIGYALSSMGSATETKIVIPSTYHGLPVVRIGGYTEDELEEIGDSLFREYDSGKLTYEEYSQQWEFYRCPFYNIPYTEETGLSTVVSVVIPDTVTCIGNGAFFACANLQSIIIPDSVTCIEEWAFCNCTALTSVEIGSGTTEIGIGAFTACSSLTEVVIPNSVTIIKAYTFRECESLTNVTIGSGVTTIGYYAFGDCSSLTEIVIPDGVTAIETCAFYNCTSLTSVTFENIHDWTDSFETIDVSNSQQNAINLTSTYLLWRDWTRS